MDTKEVTVSGTVGKQVFATSVSKKMKGFLLCALSGRARVTIRDGNASGDVKFQGSVGTSAGSLAVTLDDGSVPFDKGMHVKVLGTGATCYVYVD